jgi:hypothetical protein
VLKIQYAVSQNVCQNSLLSQLYGSFSRVHKRAFSAVCLSEQQSSVYHFTFRFVLKAFVSEFSLLILFMRSKSVSQSMMNHILSLPDETIAKMLKCNPPSLPVEGNRENTMYRISDGFNPLRNIGVL